MLAEAPVTQEPVFLLADWGNPFWRLTHLYWITDEEGEVIPFVPRPEQLEFLQNLWCRNLIPKSRQIGYTTLITLMQLDMCLFRRNHAALTVCHKLDDAKKIFRNKVQTAWQRLPPLLQSRIGLESETTEEMVFGNGSSFAVSTSGRSTTLQSLHISEYGRICQAFPEKAREIKTGSIPAVSKKGWIFIESTAAGAEGDFFSMVELAKQRQEQGLPDSILDFRLHFVPWWRKKENSIDPGGIPVPQVLRDYFKKLDKDHGIQLSAAQMAWYVKQVELFGNDVKREHPSFLDEAFEVAIEGAIFANEMTMIRKGGHIGAFPWDPRRKVNTFWDFGVGVDGATTCWFHQRVNGVNRFIGYHEKIGEGIGYWVNQLHTKPYTYGTHYLPHDGDQNMQHINRVTRKQLFAQLGVFNTKTVNRIPDKQKAIELLRMFLLTCEFHEKDTHDGIKSLDHYRREWDEKLGRYSQNILKNNATHGVDAIMQAAQGYIPEHEFLDYSMAPKLEPRAILDAATGY